LSSQHDWKFQASPPKQRQQQQQQQRQQQQQQQTPQLAQASPTNETRGPSRGNQNLRTSAQPQQVFGGLANNSFLPSATTSYTSSSPSQLKGKGKGKGKGRNDIDSSFRSQQNSSTHSYNQAPSISSSPPITVPQRSAQPSHQQQQPRHYSPNMQHKSSPHRQLKQMQPSQPNPLRSNTTKINNGTSSSSRSNNSNNNNIKSSSSSNSSNSNSSSNGSSPRVRRRRATRTRQPSRESAAGGSKNLKKLPSSSQSSQSTTLKGNRPSLAININSLPSTASNRKSSVSPPKSPRNSSGVPSGTRVLNMSDLRQNSQNNKAALKKRKSNSKFDR